MKTPLLFAILILTSLLLAGCAASIVQARDIDSTLALSTEAQTTEQIRQSLVIKYSLKNDLLTLSIANVADDGALLWKLSIDNIKNDIQELTETNYRNIHAFIGGSIIIFYW